MKRILLTGANGQLGSEVVRQAKALDLDLVALDRSQLDITDRTAVTDIVQSLAPDLIINAAAYTAVDRAETDRNSAFAVNRDGPRNLAEAAGKRGAVLMHFSTDYVFDGTKPQAYVEQDEVHPLGAYGQSKEAGEAVIRAITDRHLIIRTSWVYGVHGANFVRTMLTLARERDEIRVVTDQSGCPTYAADLAGIALLLAGRFLNGRIPADGYGTFHCAGQGQVTWYDFACKIFELAGERFGPRPKLIGIPGSEFPSLAKRPANSALDCSKLAEIHGLSARNWQDSLADMLNCLDLNA
ncbi:dTDP-4-dehydrorhamnose reductase [Roseibium sp. LAB1]